MAARAKTDTVPDDFLVPASFRYVAFYDLLGDAVFHLRLAKLSPDSFSMSRYARASILAASLSIECAANCLLDSLGLSKLLLSDLDKLPPISKIEACLRIKNIENFDRGHRDVQRVGELIKARNEHVHPKISSIKIEMGKPRDAGDDWRFPLNFDGEYWPQLKIPKRSMFWSGDNALTALKAIADFLRYVFVSLLNFSAEDFANLFSPRVETANLKIPMVFEEILEELRLVSDDGVNFPFLDTERAR